MPFITLFSLSVDKDKYRGTSIITKLTIPDTHVPTHTNVHLLPL